MQADTGRCARRVFCLPGCVYAAASAVVRVHGHGSSAFGGHGWGLMDGLALELARSADAYKHACVHRLWLSLQAAVAFC